MFSLFDTKLLNDGSFVEYIVFFDLWTVASVYKHQNAFYLFLSTFPLYKYTEVPSEQAQWPANDLC